MSNALVVHDIVVQEDTLHIKTPIALRALIQNQCTLEEYDIHMESLGMRVGEYEHAIQQRNLEFPGGGNSWFGRDLV